MTSSEKKSSNAKIEVKNLSVVAAKKVLLENANATFDAGEITLIVGPSGVGKSILMRLIAGLTDGLGDAIQYSGDVTINGEKAKCGEAGVVFQSFALFDELGPVGNIRFAKACGGAQASKVPPKEMLAKLNVPTNVPTSRLSGGQRQRLAIARTLAYNPPAILYDEPTSGLDPFTGQQVAELISDTHKQFGKTSVIVTHDYHSLMPIADRIYLLDPQLKQLVEVDREHWGSIPDKLAPMASKVRAEEESTRTGAMERFIAKGKALFESTTNLLIAFAVGVLSLLPVWKSPVWGLRSLAHFLRMVTGPTAIMYLIASGFITGFVTTYFTFKFLPFTDYTEPLLVEDLLIALGFAMYRIFIPVLGCVLIAARCGAAVTSDIGGRQYGNQIDALKTFGTSPRSYLLTPIIWTFLVATPLLIGAAFIAAKIISLIVFVYSHPARGANFWHFHFHRGLELPAQYLYRGFWWLMAKLLCSGFGIAIISYYQGLAPKYSSSDVSRSVTSTILWATLYVLTIHFLFALFEYENVVPGSR